MWQAISVALLASVTSACGPSPGGEGGKIDAQLDAPCLNRCARDLESVVDCQGRSVSACALTEMCDAESVSCMDSCALAEAKHRSPGCSYYATAMDTREPLVGIEYMCFAVVVANVSRAPARIAVQYEGMSLPVATFGRIPVGAGPSMQLTPYDREAGVPPGEVAVLFLAGHTGDDGWCPIDAAVPDAARRGTGVSRSFHITTDVPAVMFQIHPYGGARTAQTGASLLLPTSVWTTDYVAVTAAPRSLVTHPAVPPEAGSLSLNIIARDDGTVVTFTPKVAVQAGPGVTGGPAHTPFTIALDRGQNAQISQLDDLSGSSVTATKPIGFMAGHLCMNVPEDALGCDHGQQMIPPVRALGHRYAGVMYRPRVPAETSTRWRIVGAVDNTRLTYSVDVGGPTMVNQGESVTFETGTPFVVTSQDSLHPFMLFTYMTGGDRVDVVPDGHGDPEIVISVPVTQYADKYVFFADPTYPETNLVIVRRRGDDGEFKDVVLDCAGVIDGWQPMDDDLEYTRVDLITGNFRPVGNCSTGRRKIHSDAPFGLWIWGWGTPLTPETPIPTPNVSYGFPGGMNVFRIDDVD